MFKRLDSCDEHVQVFTSPRQYISTYSENAGAVRYNFQNQHLEVHDGLYWQSITNNVAGISLAPNTKQVLEWGRKKMMEEQVIEHYATKYPSVAAALEHRNQAQEMLDSVIDLVKDY